MVSELRLRVTVATAIAVAALALPATWLAGPTAAPRHVTWGCGYGAPTARMQYTGASFSAQLAAIAYAVLPHLRREKLPRGPFPEGSGRLESTCVDAVEQRMFEVLGEGDDTVANAARRIPLEPSFSLGAGLVVLVVLVWLLLASGGSVR